MKISGVDSVGTGHDILTDTSGRVIVSPSPGASTVVDGSGTITTGGTSQNLFGGTIPAAGFEIYNPSPLYTLWISKHGTAAPDAEGSIELRPGSMYSSPQNYTPNHAVSIYGAQTGQPFTAERW